MDHLNKAEGRADVPRREVTADPAGFFGLFKRFLVCDTWCSLIMNIIHRAQLAWRRKVPEVSFCKYDVISVVGFIILATSGPKYEVDRKGLSFCLIFVGLGGKELKYFSKLLLSRCSVSDCHSSNIVLLNALYITLPPAATESPQWTKKTSTRIKIQK